MDRKWYAILYMQFCCFQNYIQHHVTDKMVIKSKLNVFNTTLL